MVAEGIRLVADALDAEIPFEGVVFCAPLAGTGRGAELVGAIAARAIPIEEVDERLFRDLASTDTPQGVIAVVEPPRFSLDDVRPAAGCPVLVADGVQDPGNLGALLRTAYGLGAPGVILLQGSADVGNPKVLRGAMGASFRMPVARATDVELEAWAGKNSVTLWATVADGKVLDRADVPERLAIVVGNEGAGIRPEILALCRRRVAIPLARGVESLNVAVAAGIFLYEVQRAR